MKVKQAKLKEQAYASSLKSRALSILIYLIDRSNQELICFPAISTMAEQLHISVSTVKRALRELVDGGYISKDARFREKNWGQSSNLYTLILREQNEAKNNDSQDAGKGSKSATDDSFGIKEEQKPNFSDGVPQGTEVEHIGFKSLNKEMGGTRVKRNNRRLLIKKRGSSGNRMPDKEVQYSVKTKKSSCILRCLVGGIQVHFEDESFKACFWRLCALSGERIDKDIRVYSSAYLLFVFNVDGGGGQFKSPLNYSG